MKGFNQSEFNDFIIQNGVLGFFEEPLTLKSGRKSYFYVNWRNVFGDVFLADKVTDFIISFVDDFGLDAECFSGIPEGATKIALLTQLKWARQSPDYNQGSHVLSMGRAKPKEYGHPDDKFFIGSPKGKTIVIEDTATTASSLIKNLENLKEAGANIIGVIVLTDRMEKRDDGLSAKEIVENLGFKYYRMSSALDLIPNAIETLKPSEHVVNKVREYFLEYGLETLRLKSNIIDKLMEQIDKKKNCCIIGLDPQLKFIPEYIKQKWLKEKGNTFEAVAESIIEFNKAIIDVTHDLVPAFKLNMCFYEKYGSEGLRAFEKTAQYVKLKECILMEDAKRNEVGESTKAYAEGHLGKVDVCDNTKRYSLNVDIIVINPYLGSDGIKPFCEVCKEFGKGIFILDKTSNPSSGEFQDRFVEINENEKSVLEEAKIDVSDKTELYNLVGLKINEFAQELKGERGYSSIGAVVGATYPEQAEILRKIMPDSFFLVPGYGAQGASGKDIVNCFNSDGYGAVVNSSRGIIAAYKKKHLPEERFAEAARGAMIEMVNDVNSALLQAGKYPERWRGV